MMMSRMVLTRVVDQLDRAYNYGDLSLKAPLILKEAVSAIEYSGGNSLIDSITYEIVESASRLDFRLNDNKWKKVENLFNSIDQNEYNDITFNMLDDILKESPSWVAKRAVVKIALEALKGTK